MTSAKEVVMAYQKALGSGDWKSARKFLYDKLSFQGPIATHKTADAYLADLQKLHSIVKDVEMKKIFAEGNDVCLLYDMVTNTPAGTAFIMEWHHVRDEKIAAIRVLFDPRPFAPIFAKQP